MMDWRWLLSLMALPLVVQAQGFDWQYSVRQPATPPSTFVGFEVGYGASIHSGGLEYVERVPCCRFSAGDGTPMWIGAIVETWQRGDMALWASVGYSIGTAVFHSSEQSFPLFDGRILRTRYSYATTLGSMTLQGGVRYRPFASNLNVGAALRLGTLLHSSSELFEEVLSPDDYLFATNPPTRRHRVPSGSGVASASPFRASVALSGGYDISLTRGIYVSPMIVVGVPLTATASDADWRTYDLGFAVRFLTSFGNP